MRWRRSVLRFFTFQTIFLFFLLLLYYFLRHFSQTLSAHIVVCYVIYAAAYNDVVIVLTGRPLYHRMVFSFGFLRHPPSLSLSLCFTGIRALGLLNIGHGLLQIIGSIRLVRTIRQSYYLLELITYIYTEAIHLT